ncbi:MULTISPECIES: hypothetical protein [unclassified Ruegeria]|uniref:hypothetical protein n=1 Tax=unclassified Ruegeria TaxID=2625375 RepID=UPI0014892B48
MFWSRQLISDNLRSWVEDCFDWFDEHFEPPRKVILPTKEFFSAPGGEDHETAERVLIDVKRLLHLSKPVTLLTLDVLPEEYRHTYESATSIAGTHQSIDGATVIRYDPALLKRPLQFINLLAHELMHARLDGHEDAVPGGYEAHELATDLGCIIAGFGVFQLQSADDAGWSGYMTQPTRAFALALFLNRRGLGTEEVSPFLSGRCNRLLRKAIKAV